MKIERLMLDGLEYYDSRLKGWMGDRLANAGAFRNWRHTEKAGAVTCWPVGGTELKPVVDFLFIEVPPASGDKSPANPSTISGVSEVKASRAGKNLLFPEDFVCFPDRGLTATVNQDGSVSVSGTTVGNGILQFRAGSTSRLNTIKNSPFFPGLTYTVSMECPDPNVLGFVHYSDDGGITWTQAFSPFIGGQSRTFTVPADTTGLQIWTQTTNGITLNTTVKMQCELGETATAFEKGVKDTYTIPLGSTYYGGTVDLSTGVVTVTCHPLVIDGNVTYSSRLGLLETADTYTLSFYPEISRAFIQTNMSCNVFPVNSANTNSLVVGSQSSNIRIQLLKSFLGLGDGLDYNTVSAAFIAYFSNHPAFLVYDLYEPYTVQLSPTEILSLTQSSVYDPRVNTVYTDASAVQVGYRKSPIRDYYEKTQAIIAQGGEV